MDYTLSLVNSLKGKGMKIVGITYSYSRILTNFVRDISTHGEALETTLEDVTMKVDRVVDGFCPIPLSGNLPLFSLALICADDGLFGLRRGTELTLKMIKYTSLWPLGF